MLPPRPPTNLLVWGQRLASPRLLLRLAYARQQQGRPAAALLALSQAQAQQPRLKTWQHMAELAARQHLVGYPSTWQQALRVRSQAYYYPILEVLLLVAVLGAGALLLLRRRPTPRPLWAGFAAYLGLLGLYLHLLAPRHGGPVGAAQGPPSWLVPAPGPPGSTPLPSATACLCWVSRTFGAKCSGNNEPASSGKLICWLLRSRLSRPKQWG